MLWIAPYNFAYQNSRGDWEKTLKTDLFSVVFHIYSKTHNRKSLEGRHFEQTVCWDKFTSFLKVIFNRIFWWALVPQLMKNFDFFAVFGEKKEGFFIVVEMNLERLTYSYEELKGCHVLEIGWLQDQAHTIFASLCPKKLNNWYQCSELLHLTLHIEIHGEAENNIEKRPSFNFFHLYSKRYNEGSLESRSSEQIVCWCKLTWFLKLGVNRTFWWVLVRQLMKNKDFFAVFGEKKWRPIYRTESECRKEGPIRMKRWRIVICWKLEECKIKLII